VVVHRHRRRHRVVVVVFFVKLSRERRWGSR
jgi:hypothetical protein